MIQLLGHKSLNNQPHSANLDCRNSESKLRITLDVVKGKWCNLPVDLVNVIDDHLVLYKDKVRIRALSQIWNSYLPKLPNKQIKKLPWLLHPLDDNNEASHGLFNPVDKQVYPVYLPEAKNKLFKGSSYGWVATVEGINSSSPIDIYLINPLTGNRIKLPPRTEFPDVVDYRPTEVDDEFLIRYNYDVTCPIFLDPDFDPEFDMRTLDRYFVCAGSFTRRVLLSSAPCDECIVVAIYGNCRFLAWTKCNAKKWTHCPGISGVVDIIFDKSKLYAIDHDIGSRSGDIYALENIGSDLNFKLTKIASGVIIPRFATCHLALCFDGSLLVAVRLIDNGRKKRTYETIGFKVYKLDSLDSTLTEVKNIGGDVLFLGGFSENKLISSHNLQGLSGIKGNCIYFSDSVYLAREEFENKNSDADIGIFNLEDGTIEPLPDMPQRVWPRPVWINVD